MARGIHPPEQLARQVRSALAHLYDYAYLQNHPLAALVDAGSELDQVTRAQKLRRLLLDCIEDLRPQALEEAPSDAARAHAILTYRYVDGVAMTEIAAKRGLSERQAYRELEKGVVAVASLLRDRIHQQPGDGGTAGDAPPSPLQAAQAEVARLRQAVNAEPLDLPEVLQGVLDLLAPICKRAGISIAMDAAAPWPPVVADRVMLRQALLNLLTHALNTAGRGRLLISASPTQGHLRLDIRERAATSERRPPPSDPDEQEPVGLSVARSLLEAQGGRLEVKHFGSGWRARVTLPTGRAATILVIDDNRDLVSLVQRYLAGHQVTVVGETGGEEALRLAAELQPQLITLDVMMPSQDGWEILQRLKGSPATAAIPVIVCSVLHQPELAQSMGASDYVTKPVRQAELLQALSRWLGPLQPAG